MTAGGAGRSRHREPFQMTAMAWPPWLPTPTQLVLLAQLTLVTSKLVTPAGLAIATVRQDVPFQASAPLRPPVVTHRGPVLPVAQEMLAAVAVLMTADPCGCQDLPFQWSIRRVDLRPVPIAMQLILDTQLIWVRFSVAAGAGTARHDLPFQATETGNPGPTVRQ